ncbi:exodeoxyribonuclease VII large subunit [Psychrosphaera saromensis]|uniref:Exodeoxyribonuclease 7 large subunit n=1 Tax=Psychrosphaera saromensis TaxID=716813 RepID=A0A2S7UUU2_9GAMM|nr:exodeoxyribonuclease VII large subunit [Psychrosphaera saromensis]PQJ53498.1 exodeoxyribonuclease VII large subunit [Psychrosphaera saromensis]
MQTLNNAQQQHIYQVSELNQKARMLLEGEFVNIWISGEISNLVKASSGHWYFSLKDKRAQIKSAMFKGNNRSVRAVVENGTQVLVRGRVSLYEPRGDFQFIAEVMEPAGEGLLKQQFEQLKQQLAQMGLFDQDVKRPIPVSPKRVGIVTSPTGAAVHDILTVLKRRSPQTEVIIYPTMVQGEQAAQNIIWAINAANHRNEVDVLIVGRGGGSLEDMWCFNDEALAHTIYNSALPIISAVGHEVDVSISDFVADLRAPTPSAAAEIVSTDNSELVNKTTQLYSRLLMAYTNIHKNRKAQFGQLNKTLSLLHPSHKIRLAQQQTDELNLKLNSLIKQTMAQKQQRSSIGKEMLLANTPKHQLQLAKNKQAQLTHDLHTSFNSYFAKTQQRFASNIEKLQIVSPLATLQRGYAIATSDTGKVITNTTQVNIDDKLTIKVADGDIAVKVVESGQ